MPFDLANHYWIVATNPTQRWAGARGIYVDVSDAAYIAWDAIPDNDATNVPTEADLWAGIAQFALSIHLGGQGWGYVQYDSELSATLTNPLPAIISIKSAFSNVTYTLPPMNLPVSVPIGVPIEFRNDSSGPAIVLLRDADDIFQANIYPGEVLILKNTSFATPNGVFNVTREITNIGQWRSSHLPIDADGTLAANSDIAIPSQKAVKTYADGLFAANDALLYKGAVNCSANPNYPAADAGHLYKVSAAGKIGGASGTNVDLGDSLICTVDGSAAGTQAAVGANWTIIQSNLEGALVNGGALGTPSSGVGTNITNVNAASLGGATFAAPGAVGGGTPSTGAFTTLSGSTSVTSPLVIGGSGTTETLTYKTTTGVGAAGADHIFLVGNNGATEALRIVNAGQVGLGVTPSTNWGSQFKLIQFGAAAAQGGDATGQFFIFQNLAFDNTNFKYIQSAAAALQTIQGGQFIWYTVPSGTAGNNATITEHMRLSNSGALNIAKGVAIPAGGTAGMGVLVSSTANFGVFFGSGAPTLSAAKGSLYLRSDGSTINDRMYVNTNGSTTWTAVTTAA